MIPTAAPFTGESAHVTLPAHHADRGPLRRRLAGAALAACVLTLLASACQPAPTSDEALGSLESEAEAAVSATPAPSGRSSSEPGVDGPSGPQQPTDSPTVEPAPLRISVGAVLWSADDWSEFNHVCGSDYPVTVDAMLANDSTTHVAHNPGHRLIARDSEGRVVWKLDGNVPGLLWPGQVVTKSWFLCHDLVGRVESVSIRERGPGLWQPVGNRKDESDVVRAKDVQLRLYSLAGTLASDVTATIVNSSRSQIDDLQVSAVLYDEEGNVTAIESGIWENLEGRSSEDVEFFAMEWLGNRPIRAEVFTMPYRFEGLLGLRGEKSDCIYVSPPESPNKKGHYECTRR